MKKEFRVMITGGGSGGHIYPIIATITELQLQAGTQNISLRLKYLGFCGEYKNILEENNIKVSGIPSSKIKRYSKLSSILQVPNFIFGLLKSLWIAYWFMPDVLFSKGGPGSLPVILAAWFYRIPIVIHESDSVPGLTNMMSKRFAKIICAAFKTAQKSLGQEAIILGNPIRRTLFANIRFDEAQTKRRLGFDENKPLILVMGGSLGSVRINNFILKNLPLILEVAQVYHQTGKDNYEAVLAEATKILAPIPEELKRGYKAIDFLRTDDETRDAYISADMIVCRAGSGTIFEIAVFGKPSILIPLPESAQDHQRLNAFEYETLGACHMIEEENLLTNLFLDKLINTLGNKEKYSAMKEAALRFAKPDAASNLAKIILSLRDGRQRKK